MTTENRTFKVRFDKCIEVKVNEEIITLNPDIIEKLTLQKKSFFRKRIIKYNKAANTEKKPIELSFAPHADRFKDLVEFLKFGFSDEHSLCDFDNPDELFELSEYLKILPEDSFR